MINSWVIETVINQPDAVCYAFKGLEQRWGRCEMIVANQQTGWKHCDGVYHSRTETDSYLAEGFAAGHGGARRNATTLYQEEKS